MATKKPHITAPDSPKRSRQKVVLKPATPRRRIQNAKDQPGSTVGMAKMRSQLVADQIAAGKRSFPEESYTELPDNATPLDVLLMAMRRAFLLGGSIYAAPYAEKAAPYLHGKISTIELKNAQGNPDGHATGGPVPFMVRFVEPDKG